MSKRPKTPYAGLKPVDMPPRVWTAIVEAWQNGLSDREAAFSASEVSPTYIRESDIKKMIKDEPEIGMLRENLQAKLLAKAKKNISQKIEAGDVATAKWLLERKAADEYSTKSAVAFEGGVVALSIEDKMKAMDDFMDSLEGKKDE